MTSRLASRGRHWAGLLIAAALSLTGCMDSGPEISGQAAALGDTKPITWAACPSDFRGECAWVPLPVNHDEPDGPNIPVFVSHTPALSGHARTQLWLLQGGPGGSGTAFTGAIEQLFAPLLPDTEFFVLEHRGVGESARLGCSQFESPDSEDGTAITADEWPACVESLKAQWGEQLDYFTTTQDAHDLASLIKRTRERDKQTFVYGISYGTARSLRFLQVYPDLVDGVILDSVVSPSVQYLSHFDEQFDPVAKELAKLCAQDELCGEKLGEDPWARVLALLDKLDHGHCPEFLYRSIVKPGFTQLLMDRELRAHIFPLTYRLDRCEPEDLAVVENYLSVLTQVLAGASSPDRESIALQKHVALSELWEEPAPSAEELVARCDSQVLCPGLGPDVADVTAFWPRYPRDEYVGKWPETDTPILAMNGTLDPQTPIETAEVADTALRGEHQHFVPVPWSPHGVVFSSPVSDPAAPTCGAQLLRGFIDDPAAEPYPACVLDLLNPFQIDASVATAFFGTPDLYENSSPNNTPQPGAAETLAGVNLHIFDVKPLALPVRSLPR